MQKSNDTASSSGREDGWLAERAPCGNPHLSGHFASVYEKTENRSIGQIAALALERVENVQWGTTVLDVSAGAGALSIPAALRGASVLAVDNSPGMVDLLTQRLTPFPSSGATLMDGEDLRLPTSAFDATFSLMGMSSLPCWNRALSEQARVTRCGGKACVATPTRWRAFYRCERSAAEPSSERYDNRATRELRNVQRA